MHREMFTFLKKLGYYWAGPITVLASEAPLDEPSSQFPLPSSRIASARRRRRRPRPTVPARALSLSLFLSQYPPDSPLVLIPRSSSAAMLSLSRVLARRLFSSAAAATEGAAATSTSVVRKAQNPLEEFFEVERSTEDDQPAPHYGTCVQHPSRSPQLFHPM